MKILNKLKKYQVRLICYILFFLILELLSSYAVFRYAWRGRLFPGVSVASIPVENLTKEQAFFLVKAYSDGYKNRPLKITNGQGEMLFIPEEAGVEYDLTETIERAYRYGRSESFWGIDELLRKFGENKDYQIVYRVDEAVLVASAAAIAVNFSVPEIPPAIVISGGKVMVSKGEPGESVDYETLTKLIKHRLGQLSSIPVQLPYEAKTAFPIVDPELTKMRAEKMLEREMNFMIDDEEAEIPEWKMGGEDLVGFLSFDGGFAAGKIASYSASLAEGINREPNNAVFSFENGKVVEFVPAKNGYKLELDEVTETIAEALSKLEAQEEKIIQVVLSPMKVEPEITIEDVNDLGIKELLGKGKSTFHGSITNREYNIGLAASRINGYLVKPEEEFSFNLAVGEVSAANGYRQAYIIKDGRTTLGDGGGVCQVSTTVFRAAMESGLPISERHGHSYRVGYYEQDRKAGYDASVFAPSADFTFVNDTPAHLLIEAVADLTANSLEISIYGTADGRKAFQENHRMWDVLPPPPDLYQDDPSLPSGTEKQVDWKAWGAKAKFDYRVERNGEVIFEKTFYTTYKPWQSVFLRGTGAVQ